MFSVLLYEAETSELSAVNTQICDWRQKCQPHKFVYFLWESIELLLFNRDNDFYSLKSGFTGLPKLNRIEVRLKGRRSYNGFGRECRLCGIGLFI